MDILKQVHEPIIPRLDLNIIKHFQSLQRYQQSHVMGTNVHLSSALGYNMPTNTIAHAAPSKLSYNSIGNSSVPNLHLSHSSEPQKAENILPSAGPNLYISNVGQNLYQNEAGISKDNIEIRNISSMVQQQSSISNKTAFGQSNVDDEDDEFTEFQSSMSVNPAAPAPNVSITLNPIHYLMASPTPSSNLNNKKPNSGSTPALSNINKSQSTRVKSGTIATISNTEDDDFSDFQSALDFDVQIKQPNILDNLKTIIETKQDQSVTQNFIQKTTDEHIASVLAENVPQRTKEEVLDTMSDERKTTMYTTNDIRDYSALKELQTDQTSLFELRNSEPFSQSTTNMKNKNTFLESKTDSSVNPKQNSNKLLLQDNDIPSLTIDDHRRNTTVHKTSSSNIIFPPTTVFKCTKNVLSSPPDDDFDDEFTDFKQAEPINLNTDDKVIANNNEPVKLISDVKTSSNYDCLRDLNDDNSLDANLFPSVFHKDKSNQQGASVPRSNIIEPSNNVDNILFGGSDIISNYYDKGNTNEDDDFDEFVQVPHIPSTFNSFSAEHIKTSENQVVTQDDNDDEFTDFEQAPKPSTNSTANVLSSITITPQPNTMQTDIIIGTASNKIDILELDNDAKASTGVFNDDLKIELDKKHRDKYSALRGLDFLDEDNDYKDLSDGDTLSLQEEKDRDISDGDNVSLQLPWIESQEQDNVQVREIRE